MSKPVVWTIAGSDSCGGAGISADMQTFHQLGVHGCQVMTAVTSQHLHDITDSYFLPPAIIRHQLDALLHMVPAAIKIGMLGHVKTINAVSSFIREYNGRVILDPLFISSSQQKLFNGEFDDYRRQLLTLFPHVYLLTPNRYEAEVILGKKLNTFADIECAAREMIKMGVKNVVIKGGHFTGEFSQDYWTDGSESCWLASRRYPDIDCHGTGCVLSSAVAACLAKEYAIKDALVIAKMYVNRGIRLSDQFFNHAHGWPEDEIDLPYMSPAPVNSHLPVFNRDDQFSMGLYPVVDSVEWLRKLLPLGIDHIQLRIKHLSGSSLESEIQAGIILAKSYQAKLFINDYWQLAIQYGAYGVHLGQEDLDTADVAAIHAAGLRLGISTHCYYEVARAHTFQPSYIACGPVFPTTSKEMKFAPLGLQALARWRRTLQYPLVAIGGIDARNIRNVYAAKIDGAALISAITKAADPVSAAQELLHYAA